MSDLMKFIEENAVMFSEANVALRGIDRWGTEVFIPVFTDNPEALKEKFQQLLDEQYV